MTDAFSFPLYHIIELILSQLLNDLLRRKSRSMSLLNIPSIGLILSFQIILPQTNHIRVNSPIYNRCKWCHK